MKALRFGPTAGRGDARGGRSGIAAGEFLARGRARSLAVGDICSQARLDMLLPGGCVVRVLRAPLWFGFYQRAPPPRRGLPSAQRLAT